MDSRLFQLMASGQLPIPNNPIPTPQIQAEMLPSVTDQFNLYLQMEIYKTAFQQYMAKLNQPFPHDFTYPEKMVSPAPGQLPLAMPTPKLPSNRLLLPTILADDTPPPPTPAIPTMAPVAKSLSTSTPTPTPSPRTSTDSPSCLLSPSTTSSSSAAAKDDESDLFVDVESIDNRLEGKDRRKAHIEFYRKMKSIRQREKLLTCVLCNQNVNNNDNAIISHVNHHAGAGGYRCKICGWDNAEKYKIYEHMRKLHQHKTTLIEDRRDMLKLCSVIQECFPRVSSRTKKDYEKDVEKILRQLGDDKGAALSCEICEKDVAATRSAILKHAQAHPSYRCKECKTTTLSEADQLSHQLSHHKCASPRPTVDYNVSAAADVVSKTIQRCFAKLLSA